MTLYTFARDVEAGTSACTGQCASNWPPMIADGDAKPQAAWSLIKRSDGRRQWAYEDKPLYRYRLDEAPGDTYGEGSRGLWDLAFIPIETPPGITIEKTLQGHVAADAAGMTLYAPAGDYDVEALCVAGSCARDWVPVKAPGAARDLENWSVVTRRDGLRQWAYDGRPLFRYANDVHPREITGENEPFNSGLVAVPLILEPRPPYPDWVRVHNTDAGQMLANSSGKTIYTYDPSRVRPNRYAVTRGRPQQSPGGCELDCLPSEWEPIFAEEAARAPGGNWAIVTLSDGRRQWMYKGNRIFTNVRDKTQGSFLGYRHGGSREWNVIMHNEEALVGTLRPP